MMYGRLNLSDQFRRTELFEQGVLGPTRGQLNFPLALILDTDSEERCRNHPSFQQLERRHETGK
jgi:hypothetical protein